MRIIHFGATGNLGVHVLPRLLQTEHEVTCVVRSESRFRDAFDSPSCSMIEADALDMIEADALDASAVDAFLTQLRESSQARNDHVNISSFAPRPELCGPPGCLPKQEQQQAEDPDELFHQSTTGSYVTQEGYSMWLIGGVFLAGFFTGRGFSPNQRQRRFEGYESI